MQKYIHLLIGPGAVEIFANKQWHNSFINFFRGGLTLFENPYSLPLFTAGPCHGGQYPRLGDTKNPGSPKPGTE